MQLDSQIVRHRQLVRDFVVHGFRAREVDDRELKIIGLLGDPIAEFYFGPTDEAQDLRELILKLLAEK